MNLHIKKQLWFHHIYQNHQNALLLWFKSKLNNHHQCEDLSQEVFYRAFKSDYSFDNIREPKAWLISIAKHVIIDHWRHQHIELSYLETLIHTCQQTSPSAEHEISMREVLCQLQQKLDTLPHRAAQVFLLSQLEGLTYKSIGDKLQISEATVKRDMKQALIICNDVYKNIYC